MFELAMRVKLEVAKSCLCAQFIKTNLSFCPHTFTMYCSRDQDGWKLDKKFQNLMLGKKLPALYKFVWQIDK